MEERVLLLPNHGYWIQHVWKERKKLKRNEWYFLRTAVSPRGRGSWRGEEGWDVYEVCGDFWRKLTEGGQMVGGTGNVILSLSLLGRAVQTQPRSRMAQSHLQQMAILVLHEKTGWWGSAPRWIEDRAGFFPSALEDTYGIICRDVQRRLVRCNGWSGIVQTHSTTSPSRDIIMGCGCYCGQERRMCAHLLAPTASPCTGKISFYIRLISDSAPI